MQCIDNFNKMALHVKNVLILLYVTLITAHITDDLIIKDYFSAINKHRSKAKKVKKIR